MNLETWLWQRAWTLYPSGSRLPWGLAVNCWQESLFLWTPLGTGCQLLTGLTTYVDLPWDGHGLFDYWLRRLLITWLLFGVVTRLLPDLITWFLAVWALDYSITWLSDYCITGGDHPDGRSLLRSNELDRLDTAAWLVIKFEHSSIETCWLLVTFMVSNTWWIFVLLK